MHKLQHQNNFLQNIFTPLYFTAHRPSLLLDISCPIPIFPLYPPCGRKRKSNERYPIKQDEKPPEYPAELRLLSLRQVSEILGLSYNGTYNIINARKIKSIKIGTRRLFTVRAVRDYIKSLEEADEA